MTRILVFAAILAYKPMQIGGALGVVSLALQEQWLPAIFLLLMRREFLREAGEFLIEHASIKNAKAS